MAEKEEDNRLKNAGETTVVVVDQQPSTDSRNKPHSDQDEPSDAIHKWSKVPDIPSVAEQIKDDLGEMSQVISKPSDKNKVPREISKHQASGVQSTTSHVPEVKPLENIELAQITSERAEPEVKQRVETAFPTKMESEAAMPKSVKRFETTFPAKMESEPVVSEVVQRFETTASMKKESEPVVPGATKRLEATEAKVKPSEPISTDVKSQIKKGSEVLEKTEEEKSDEDSMLDDAAVLPIREDTRLSDWSDDQEAGGLPRTGSLSSRVSHAVRQLFCCGVAYYPPSEDNISTLRHSTGL